MTAEDMMKLADQAHRCPYQTTLEWDIHGVTVEMTTVQREERYTARHLATWRRISELGFKRATGEAFDRSEGAMKSALESLRRLPEPTGVGSRKFRV